MTDQAAVNDPNPDNVEDANTLLLEPKEAPKPAPSATEPAKVEPDADTPVAFEPTGDVGLDMALEFLGKQGFGLQHPAMVAAGNGDFTVLEALLAQKNAQGWQQMVALGKAGYERTQNAQKEAVSKTLATVEAVAGSKEEWA
ncbi:hypothetical protein EGC79_20520, partial [Shewanella vesiculosa]